MKKNIKQYISYRFLHAFVFVHTLLESCTVLKKIKKQNGWPTINVINIVNLNITIATYIQQSIIILHSFMNKEYLCFNGVNNQNTNKNRILIYVHIYTMYLLLHYYYYFIINTFVFTYSMYFFFFYNVWIFSICIL